MGEISFFNQQYIPGLTLVSALGWLLFGCKFMVIFREEALRERLLDIDTGPHILRWAMCGALLGCIHGALGSGYFSKKAGRKFQMIGASALFILNTLAFPLLDTALNQFRMPWYIYRASCL